MSEALLRAEREFEAARRNLEEVMSLPIEDTFPVGTAIRWYKNGKWNVAIKIQNGSQKSWRCHLYSSDVQVEWSTLVVNLKGSEKVESSNSATWTSIKKEPDPPFKMEETEEGWEISRGGTTWRLHGEQWAKVS